MHVDDDDDERERERGWVMDKQISYVTLIGSGITLSSNAIAIEY